MNRKRIIISITVALALIVIAGGIIFGANRSVINTEQLISLGEKYLSELNYEQALVQFLKVIEIDTMNPRGYIGAAESYIGLGEEDKAIEILEMGLTRLPNNEAIKSMLEMIINMTYDGESIVSAVNTFDFDWWTYFSEGRMPVQKNEKCGVIDKTGRIVIPLEYDYVHSFSNGVAIVEKGEKYGLIDLDGNIILPVEYSHISFQDNHGQIFTGKQEDTLLEPGLIDLKGNILVPTGTYDFIGSFNDGLAMVQKSRSDGYTDNGFIGTDGSVVVPPIYIQASDFSEGYAIVDRKREDGSYESCVLNTSGETIIPFGSHDGQIMFGFNDGLALISFRESTSQNSYLLNEEGYIDINGNVIFRFDDFYSSYGFREGYASVWREGKNGFIDKTGNVVIPFEYDSGGWFQNGYVAIKKGDYWGMIDKGGQTIIPFEYDDIYFMNETFLNLDIYETRKGDKKGLISKDCSTILPAEYDYIELRRQEIGIFRGLIPIGKQGKYGYADYNCEIIIPLIYDSAGHFMNGYASVSKDGKYGVINENGDFVIPFGEYETVNVVGEGLALVQNKGERSIIELPGSTILKQD